MVYHNKFISIYIYIYIYICRLDLENAYGSVRHPLIEKALDFFWIPEYIRKLISGYYKCTYMRFSNAKYSTNWQKLNIGIMMGCVISPLIFVLVMEMLLRCTKDTTSQKTVPSRKAFMDDVTVISELKSHMEKQLKRLQELFKWAVMKVKPSKSRSLSIIKGKCQEIKFAINNNVVPTIREKSVKSAAARLRQEWQYRLDLPKLCYHHVWRLMRLGYRTCLMKKKCNPHNTRKMRKKPRSLLFPSTYWSSPVARSFKTIKRWITLHW